MEQAVDGEDRKVDAMTVARDWNLRFRLRLPEPLEAAFRAYHCQQAAAALRRKVFFILALYLLLSTGIYLLLPARDVGPWLSLYGLVGVVILVAVGLSRWPALDRWFPVYASICCFLGVALSVAVTGVLRNPVAGQLTQSAINYAMVIVYGLVGLRFGQALAVGWLGGIAGVLLSLALGGHMDWALWLRTYIGSSLLGMCLAYYADHRARALFLQLQQIEQLTYEDPLTGLPNQRQFMQSLQREWRRALREQRPLGVMLVDVDDLEHFSHRHGHARAEDALCGLADILSRYARRPGDVAARLGGGEFVLLLPDMLPESITAMATRLHTEISQGFAREPDFTASMGVAVAVPFSDWNPQWLLDAAGRATAEARSAGGNTWRFGPFRVVGSPLYAVR